MNTTRRASWALLAGIATGFLLATWEGHRASTYSKPANFKRFHQRISPDAIFYPPYAMLEKLALVRWRPGKTIVILGGNSVMNGVAQPENEVWSLRLQEALGEDYVVVNLAFRGAMPMHGGALVAEALLRKNIPVIYVANTYPLTGSNRAVGGPYGYLYWQALAQGKLGPYEPRTKDIRDWLSAQPPAERNQQSEEHLGAWLETFTRHQSLWHHVGYRHVFTVWNFLLGWHFWVPRDRLPDNEPASPPVEARFHSPPLDEELNVVRSFTAGFVTQNASGNLEIHEAQRRRIEAEIVAAFPPVLRSHTLMLLDESASYYLDRLSPAEQARDRFVYEQCAQIWRAQGIACEIMGQGADWGDYFDRVHLSAEGGRKRAAVVADRIKQFHIP